MRRTTVLVTALFVACTMLAGCSGVVKVAVPAAGGARQCAALARALPRDVDGQDARQTSPTSAAVHAWGDPAIVLRCGVPSPGPSSERCVGVNGVDWVLTSLSDGKQFVSYGRTPAVEVLVPHHYAPEVNPLVDLASAVRTIPQGPHRCL